MLRKTDVIIMHRPSPWILEVVLIISVGVALILAGASFLSLSMGFTGIPRGLADLIASWELSRFQLLMALLVFYVVLGCFLDGISSVVLTMAVVEPMIRAAGIDLIWFGIFIVNDCGKRCGS